MKKCYNFNSLKKHIKIVYRELIDEATANRRLGGMIEKREEKLKSLRKQMKEKEEILRRYRRTQELYEHVM